MSCLALTAGITLILGSKADSQLDARIGITLVAPKDFCNRGSGVLRLPQLGLRFACPFQNELDSISAAAKVRLGGNGFNAQIVSCLKCFAIGSMVRKDEVQVSKSLSLNPLKSDGRDDNADLDGDASSHSSSHEYDGPRKRAKTSDCD